MKFIRKILFLLLLIIAVLIYLKSQDGTMPANENPIIKTPKTQVPPSRPLTRIIGKVDEIFVDKSERLMQLKSEGQVVHEYEIALGSAPIGQKTRQGDGKTPTGEYVIDYRNAQSSYFLSLHISYPNPDQVKAAHSDGRDPGGMIMIHGQPNTLKLNERQKLIGDWTAGCISVTNGEMKEIWNLVSDGTKITIVE